MSTLSTGTLLTTAFTVRSDLSGNLQIQTGTSSANAVLIDSNQNVTFNGSITSNTITSAAATSLTLKSAGTTALTLNSSQAIGLGSTPSFGTNGQVLTSAGSSASPTWTTLSTTSISNGTSNVSVASSGGPVTIATNGNTAVTIDTSQNATFAGTIKSTGKGVVQNYDYLVPTTGFSYTFSTYNTLIINPAGTLLTGTITMPASPSDGMVVSFSSTKEITTLTLNANTGQTLNNTIPGLVPGQSISYIYRSASTSWFVFSTALTPTFLTTLANLGFYTVSYLVVAGGGGGSGGSGGGGAGGLLTSSTSVLTGTAYTVTVGAGGSAQPAATGVGDTGGNSSIGSLVTALGGGGGSSGTGVSGGSGGGGRGGNGGGSGTTGQGNAGGGGGGGNACGGGGGASAAGNSGSGSSGGTGGAGTASSISGSSVTYAGGGGGAGAGGNGSGGAGGGGAYPNAATVNSGGGGGCTWNAPNTGTNGGSGIVIISYSGSQKGTGGTVTSSGGNTIHTFTSSGTYTA